MIHFRTGNLNIPYKSTFEKENEEKNYTTTGNISPGLRSRISLHYIYENLYVDKTVNEVQNDTVQTFYLPTNRYIFKDETANQIQS